MSIFKRIIYRLLGKNTDPDQYQVSDSICEKIRSGGGKVGSNTHILNSQIQLTHPSLISIGNDVTITGAQILTHDASMLKKTNFYKVGSVTIGNNVFISVKSIILPGVTIGNNVVIGAGCVISKDIPDNVVIIGSPPRVLCSYDDYIKKQMTRIENTVVFNGRKEYYENNEKLKMLIDKKLGFVDMSFDQ